MATSKLQLSYPAVKILLAGHAVNQRTESRQFLAWFLANYFRLEDTEIDDSICDGVDDKGIDGIYVNEQLAQIIAFQSRLFTTAPKQLGDSQLREFCGALSQLRTEDSVRNIESTTRNRELANLLRDNDVAKKVGSGFTVQGIFLTNVKRNEHAAGYLKSTPELTLYDLAELQKNYIAIDKTTPIQSSIKFSLRGVPSFEYKSEPDLKMILAPIAARELVTMTGIASGELFAWNVRQWLDKKTKVNRDVEVSIRNKEEHRYFPAFHNGLTILCKTLQIAKNSSITISGYAVVNGCQSLTGLYSNKSEITDKLRILTKFILVSPETPLARKITDHTNNQNGTTYRDLQSNNPLQTRLQTEINTGYSGRFYYRIKRGEHLEWDQDRVIENELAARILLAFDVREPWSCHQTYKLFDELHAAIFGKPEVTGDRVVTVHEIYQAAIEQLKTMENSLFGQYGLTRFLMLYLVREALATDATGNELIQSPSGFIAQRKGLLRLRYSIGKLSKTLARLLDKEITRRSTPEPFDFKRELKSQTAVRELSGTVIAHYKITLDSELASTFSEIWKASKKAAKN